jgi:exo-beta-1,3-glucanase (GH17 family)/cellulose synthase/poly-beta-1,6-N-acetylglucosamine synthase-like glycosyltransferase
MRSVAAVVALVVCVHAGLWALLQRQQSVPDFDGPLASISYSPYTRYQDPDLGDRPSAAQIRADLALIAPYARAIRTYSSTGGLEQVPGIAAEFGLKVSVGVWISKDKDRNEREIQSAVDLARHHTNVTAIVVGNETILRADETFDQLIELIRRVKRISPVPVTTGETWDVWLGIKDGPEVAPDVAREFAEKAPQLASAVDFVAAHVLPYWEPGASANRAVELAISHYDQLRRAYPGKRIVIAEFGWPSTGYNFHDSDPGRIEQAMVLRDFTARAQAYGIDYNLIEAFDQPWKARLEGSVGPYWGVFDVSRQAKFAWTGPVSDPDYRKFVGLAVLLGLLLSLPILAKTHASTREATILAVAANGVGAWFAIVFAFWNGHYFVPGSAFAFALGVALLVPLVLIALARVEEIAAVAFGRRPRRLIAGALPAPEGFAPKVSIHIPAYCEPPDMLKATLDAVARLQYPSFECVVVINNTPDPAYWRPIEEHCRALGERFKFVNADNLPGFKAGALRLALEHTAPDASIIGIIDADYVVQPDWLKDLVPAFADPMVGIVQAPQDHRDGERTLMHHAMNSEYAGFFNIGMVMRNEANAIITHGTMCLMRRAAIEAGGGWSSDTICEDTDLGLTMLEHGWQVHYTNRRYGHGLLPDTFEAYKKQRYRWAYGGFQILKKHWRQLLPRARRLAPEQKREFALGWLTWLGAESLGVAVAILNLAWVPVVAFLGIAIPDKILTLPILAAFAVTLIHFVALYRLRVPITVKQMVGAVLAAMSVQLTVARAVGCGVWTESVPFTRTAKGGSTRKGPDFPAFWEGFLAALLLIGALVVVHSNDKQIREINLFALVLVVQSLPFLAAIALALIEGSRFNEFAYWRSVEAKVAETLPRPAPVAEAPAQLPVLPTEMSDVRGQISDVRSLISDI